MYEKNEIEKNKQKKKTDTIVDFIKYNEDWEDCSALFFQHEERTI